MPSVQKQGGCGRAGVRRSTICDMRTAWSLSVPRGEDAGQGCFLGDQMTLLMYNIEISTYFQIYP